jgi:hypothetical protein
MISRKRSTAAVAPNTPSTCPYDPRYTLRMAECLDLVDIIGHRVATEARLSALLKQAKRPATVEDIKRLIYNWRHDERFSAYVTQMLKVCDTPLGSADIDEAVTIIQDAWNYFPRRSLKPVPCPTDLRKLCNLQRMAELT